MYTKLLLFFLHVLPKCLRNGELPFELVNYFSSFFSVMSDSFVVLVCVLEFLIQCTSFTTQYVTLVSPTPPVSVSTSAFVSQSPHLTKVKGKLHLRRTEFHLRGIFRRRRGFPTCRYLFHEWKGLWVNILRLLFYGWSTTRTPLIYFITSISWNVLRIWYHPWSVYHQWQKDPSTVPDLQTQSVFTHTVSWLGVRPR